MRRLLGFPVLAVGVLFGFQTADPEFFASVGDRFKDKLTETVVAKTSAPAEEAAPVSDRTATFAAGRTFLAAADRRAARLAKPVPVPVPVAEVASVVTVAAARETTPPAWQTTVTVTDVPRPVPAVRPSRYELAAEIQRELKRVGCYWGRIDGSWGAGSKRALGAFMDRANAALPTEEPDTILLSLIKSHQGDMCGATCPAGQSFDRGRCTPSAILASNGRRTSERDRNAVTVAIAQPTPVVAPPAPLPGRMSIGGPRPPQAVAVPAAPVPVPREVIAAADIDPTAGTGVTAPITGDGEPLVVSPEEGAGVAEPPVEPPKAQRSRDRRESRGRRGGYGQSGRSVQNLFRHPLGTM